jgi:NADH-quinone oxidoreductase subunit A
MPNSLNELYFPVLAQGLLALVLAGVLVLISYALGKKVRNKVKDTPYESGIVPTGDARSRFSVKFYLVAMLFILFDIEIVFMFPWAVVYRDHIAAHGSGIFWSMFSFAGILTVGYVYAIMKGALDWKR